MLCHDMLLSKFKQSIVKKYEYNKKILNPVVRRRFDFYLFSGICQTSEDLYARMVFWMWLSALLRPHRSVHVLLFKFYQNFIQISKNSIFSILFTCIYGYLWHPICLLFGFGEEQDSACDLNVWKNTYRISVNSFRSKNSVY